MNKNTKVQQRKLKNNDIYLLSNINRNMANMLLIYDGFLFARVCWVQSCSICRLSLALIFLSAYNFVSWHTRSRFNFYSMHASWIQDLIFTLSSFLASSCNSPLHFPCHSVNKAFWHFIDITLKIIYNKYLDRFKKR